MALLEAFDLVIFSGFLAEHNNIETLVYKNAKEKKRPKLEGSRVAHGSSPSGDHKCEQEEGERDGQESNI